MSPRLKIYSAFGEPTVSSGKLAASFTHQFSTKPYCAVTGFSEYQMRKYRPDVGRWFSRDKIVDLSFYFDVSLKNLWTDAGFVEDFNIAKLFERFPFLQTGLWLNSEYLFHSNNIKETDFIGLFPCLPSQIEACNLACKGKKNLSRSVCHFNLIVCHACYCVCRWNLFISTNTGTGYYRTFFCTYKSPLGQRIHEDIYYWKIPGDFSCPLFREGGCDR